MFARRWDCWPSWPRCWPNLIAASPGWAAARRPALILRSEQGMALSALLRVQDLRRAQPRGSAGLPERLAFAARTAAGTISSTIVTGVTVPPRCQARWRTAPRPSVQRDARWQAYQQGEHGQGRYLPGGDPSDLAPEQPRAFMMAKSRLGAAPDITISCPRTASPSPARSTASTSCAVDGQIVGDAVGPLVGHQAGGLLDCSAETGHRPEEAGDVGGPCGPGANRSSTKS